MSTPETPPTRSTDDVDPDERTAERIRENLDTWERVANSDLPIAEDAQRVLEWLDEYETKEGDDA